MWTQIPPASALVLVLIAAGPVLALGTEGRGNAPLPSGYVKNAALLPLANHKNRVYWREVNGDVQLFYRGDAEALNGFLLLFGGIQQSVRETILLPGPGETHTFDRAPIACDWQFHIPDGFYLHFANAEKGTQVMTTQPTITVFVSRISPKLPPDPKKVERWIVELNDDKFVVREKATYELVHLGPLAETALRRALENKPSADLRRRLDGILARLDGVNLSQLRLPAALTVLGTADLSQRYHAGLKSTNSEIRGHAIGGLGQLARYSDEPLAHLLAALKSGEHEYVRRYAASACAQLGARAQPALPLLREGLADGDKNIRHAFQRTIEMIDEAPGDGKLHEHLVELQKQLVVAVKEAGVRK